MKQFPSLVPVRIRDAGNASSRNAGSKVFDQRRLREWADHTLPPRAFSSQDHLDFEIDLKALSERAVYIYEMRRIRSKHFDQDLFGEPGWDILLDLFIAFANRERISTTSCCIASAAPASTALRWIGELVETGLVKREPSLTDRRSSYVSLTQEGALKMARFLTSLGDW